MTAQVEKLNKIDVNKFNKEKKLNYEDKRKTLDDKIKKYDKSLSKIIIPSRSYIKSKKRNTFE
jgi:hypothetical protein